MPIISKILLEQKDETLGCFFVLVYDFSKEINISKLQKNIYKIKWNTNCHKLFFTQINNYIPASRNEYWTPLHNLQYASDCVYK